MTAEEQDISMDARETKIIDPSPLTDSNGNIVDLSASSITWVVMNNGKKIIEKTTADDIEITSADDGEWQITLHSTDTDGHGGIIGKHEGRLVDGNSRDSVVTKGRFTIEASDT